MIIKCIKGEIDQVFPWSKHTSIVEVCGDAETLLGIAPDTVVATRGSEHEYYFLTMSSESTGIMQFVFTSALDAVAAAWISQNTRGFGLGKAAFVTGQYGVAKAYLAAKAKDYKFFKGSGIAATGMMELEESIAGAAWLPCLGLDQTLANTSMQTLVSLGYAADKVAAAMKKLGAEASVQQILAELA